jgi:predicted GIY-YIG superfamily endonuclease
MSTHPINSYGLRWNPDFVNWGTKQQQDNGTRLIGIANDPAKKLVKHINCWHTVAVYALYSRNDLVYLGLTEKLGWRIREHYLGKKFDKFTTFSWFGLNKIAWSQGRMGKAPAPRGSYAAMLKALEAFAIAVNDPILNKKTEPIVGATEFQQFATWVPSSESERTKLIYRLSRI